MPRALSLIAVTALTLACRNPALPTDTSGLSDDARPGSQIPLARFRPDTFAYAAYSGLTESQRSVIEDEASWEDLWTRIHAVMSPAPALPSVDFSEDVVIVAALGSRPSGGYAIRIDTVQQTGAGIEVLVRQVRPGPGCGVTTAITSPVDLVRVPRVAADADFREVELTHDCQ